MPRRAWSAEDLRGRITGLIGELRVSVFDLRHEVDEQGSLSGALSEYVRELSTRSALRVHLTLDERDARLSRRTEDRTPSPRSGSVSATFTSTPGRSTSG